MGHTFAKKMMENAQDETKEAYEEKEVRSTDLVAMHKRGGNGRYGCGTV